MDDTNFGMDSIFYLAYKLEQENIVILNLPVVNRTAHLCSCQGNLSPTGLALRSVVGVEVDAFSVLLVSKRVARVPQCSAEKWAEHRLRTWSSDVPTMRSSCPGHAR